MARMLRIEPQESGAGYEFENAIVGGVIPREYIQPLIRVLKNNFKMVLSRDTPSSMSSDTI